MQEPHLRKPGNVSCYLAKTSNHDKQIEKSMKKIGLVGGISWTSTLDYYRFINEGVNAKLGGLNFAECIIYSLNFGDIYTQSWDNAFDLLFNACDSLKKSGADGIA